ncbi:hypothetical protein VE01_04596 [Pseudogymnoascus verrucosus]|uniref:Uncharacterized protein n=1 Tax=Pseudogymnoascus verrucosus TaxID=342668 RepID=A0A1B8GPD0_9PEZI|nr:uncharacterized protein VE01_04596 [Pseudogymnoascus verrucosus]OBT97674.1 hypothetical protein VE01_04596 [Pseudogymnoascus verrucosus]
MIEPMARTAERMPKVIVWIVAEESEEGLEKMEGVAVGVVSRRVGTGVGEVVEDMELRVGRSSVSEEVEDMASDMLLDIGGNVGMPYLDPGNNGAGG